jgi:glycosyltransferase involved in cell wall biosynthesis
MFSAIPLIISLCRKNKYDLNHTHFIYPDGVLAFLLYKITGLRYVLTAHGSDVPGYNPDRFKLLHRFLAPLWRIITNQAVKIIIPSKSLGNLIKKTHPSVRTIEIPNGINLDKFSPHRKKENKILVVTRMFERKGIQYFIRALSGLRLNYIINIVGEGPYLNDLKNLSGSSSTEINFIGYLDNNSGKLRELYESSRIFVHPSRAENFPVALLEAMIAGLAIITTNDTGCAEVVGSDAMLVNSGDPSAIREALMKLINNPELCSRLGRNARKRAERFFGWSTIAGKHFELYSELTQKNLSLNPPEMLSA